ncbi:MAG: DUF72 domain-containing protein [Planctomycetes bacterium]|nr:DUF72 domain-containing protein [Planctomycetota bacterium]
MSGRYEIPAAFAGHVRIGTCSWKYDSWKGLVYTPDRHYRAEDYLADYAQHFTTVEIDQWFWSLFPSGAKLPNPEVVPQYAASVPEDFRFTVKAPNALTLTHHYAKQPKGSEAHANEPNPHFLDVSLLNRFLEILAPLHTRLGPILFQFEYLNKQKMPSLAAFLARLHAFFEKAPRGFQYAVETRNPNYLKDEFVDALRQLGLGFVLLDGYYMPRIPEVAAQIDIRTASFSILRLHGPDRPGIEKETGGTWNEIVEPKDEGLAATADLVRQNVDFGLDTYVNVNNHYEGSAPLTIQRLLDLLRRIAAPAAH